MSHDPNAVSMSHYERLNAMSPEQYLVGEVKALLLAQHASPRHQVSSSGLVQPMTRMAQGIREGKIVAYLDAILAVRAGSAYFANSGSLLRSDLLAEALSEREA